MLVKIKKRLKNKEKTVKYIKYNMVLLAVIVLIIRCIFAYISFGKYKSDENTIVHYVCIKELKSIDKNKQTYLAIHGTCVENMEGFCKVKFNEDFLLNIYTNGQARYTCGKILKVNGKIIINEFANNEGEFNYKKHLNSKNIYGNITVYELDYKGEHNVEVVENCENIKFVKPWYMVVLECIAKFRQHLSDLISRTLPKGLDGLVKGIIYGDTLDISENTKKNFEKIGISHLTAVSGENVATVIMVACLLLDKIKLKTVLKEIIKCIIATLFMILASFELSIVRATMMVMISSIFELFFKINKYKVYYSIFLSLYIIMLYNPYAILNTGLQLSFLATLSIVIFSKKITNKVLNVLKLSSKDRDKNVFIWLIKKTLNVIVSMICITISAQILLLPLQLSNFKSYPLMILVSNLFAGILDTPIRLSGVMASYFSFIPLISKIFFYIAGIFAMLLDNLAQMLASVCVNVTVIAYPPIVWFLYYLSVIGIYMCVNIQEKSSKGRKKRLKKLKVIVTIILCVNIVIISIITIHTKYTDNYAYYFNVGQGQMTLISFNNKYILIDCGSTQKNRAGNTLLNYLQEKNISSIDALVITHFHDDHINGIEILCDKYNIKEVYFAKPPIQVTEYTELYQLFREKEVLITQVYETIEVDIGKIKLNVFLSDKQIIQDKDILNANSLIALITVNDKKLLFTGDATVLTEEKLIQNNSIKNLERCFVFQVSHHGSSTSNNEAFLKVVSPYIAVISSKKSVYGHPSSMVLERLKIHATYVYILEQVGGIKIPI